MSYFAFRKDANGNAIITDQDVAEYMEKLLNQLALLNARIEEAFQTNIDIEDIDDES